MIFRLSCRYFCIWEVGVEDSMDNRPLVPGGAFANLLISLYLETKAPVFFFFFGPNDQLLGLFLTL